MARNDILWMARQADREWDCDRNMVEWLEHFAGLVAEMEREACALIVEHKQVPLNWNDRECFAKAIRARSEKPPVKTYCGGKPNYCTPEVTTEVTGDVGACVTCGAPKSEWLVNAVNISQECVNETAKGEHEPDAPDIVVVNDSGDGSKTMSWVLNLPLPVGTRLYTAPPISDYHEGLEEGFKAAKREWVGLTDEEINDWFFQRLKQANAGWRLDDVIRAVEAKLKEKNGG